MYFLNEALKNLLDDNEISTLRSMCQLIISPLPNPNPILALQNNNKKKISPILTSRPPDPKLQHIVIVIINAQDSSAMPT